jgi:hypothetical protein
MPFLDDVTNQIAANHVDSDVCDRWKIVPAVADVLRPHSAHIQSPAPVRQHRLLPHRGQETPSRQRSTPRYSRQVTSSGNQDRNSWYVRG